MERLAVAGAIPGDRGGGVRAWSGSVIDINGWMDGETRLKVIPKITPAKTAEIAVGEFVFLLDGGVEKPLAVRSEGNELGDDAPQQFVIRLDGPRIESHAKIANIHG
jgi:hypothetical protein